MGFDKKQPDGPLQDICHTKEIRPLNLKFERGHQRPKNTPWMPDLIERDQQKFFQKQWKN
jgi:hypothetical protein